MTDTRHPQIEFLKREDRWTLTQAQTQGHKVMLFSLQEQGTNGYTNGKVVNYGMFHPEAPCCLSTVEKKKKKSLPHFLFDFNSFHLLGKFITLHL